MNWYQPTYWIAWLIGLALLSIGLGAVFFPKFSSQSFGIEVSSSQLPYVRATGARDIFMGLVIFILCWHPDPQVLGMVCTSIAVVSVIDFILTRKYGQALNSWIHLAGTLVVIAYGSFLLSQ